MRAIFFTIERTMTGEQASLYYDEMPRRYTGAKAREHGLIYALRLDTLPNASVWLSKSVAQLYEVYCALRDAGRLPRAA